MIKKEIYRCEHCGNLVEALWNGEPPVSCCGTPMIELKADSTDAAVEKHVPVITQEGNKVTVTVGSVDHPMTPEHYILFVELLFDNKVLRHDFKEGDSKAVATFLVEDGVTLKARAFCNLHGLWQSA